MCFSRLNPHSRLTVLCCSAEVRSWTPNNNDQNQFLQVDLGRVLPVYAVTVKGNRALGSSVTQFELLHSLDGTIFSYAVNRMAQPAVSVASGTQAGQISRSILEGVGGVANARPRV